MNGTISQGTQTFGSLSEIQIWKLYKILIQILLWITLISTQQITVMTVINCVNISAIYPTLYVLQTSMSKVYLVSAAKLHLCCMVLFFLPNFGFSFFLNFLEKNHPGSSSSFNLFDIYMSYTLRIILSHLCNLLLACFYRICFRELSCLQL